MKQILHSSMPSACFDRAISLVPPPAKNSTLVILWYFLIVYVCHVSHMMIWWFSVNKVRAFLSRI